jgi:aspartyl aminopeptidase
MPKRTSKSKKPAGDGLQWKRENQWASISDAEARKVEEYCARYIAFLSKVKTEREAHDEGLRLARAVGFEDFQARAARGGALQAGENLVLSCRGKTLVLVRVGRRPVADGLRILGGHVDAPRLDAKPNPIYEDSELVLLDTHYYGGVRKYHWVARPLALHGVVVRRNGETVPVCIGEEPGDPVFCITDLLPHLAKDQREKKLDEGISGEGLNLLVGSRPPPKKGGKADDKPEKMKRHILSLLHERYGITEEDFASAEIEIVPAGPARELGFDRSMILGYAHDDRACSYAALAALLESGKQPEFTSMVLLCDKEEIGSVGATGMNSMLFENAVAELMALQSAGATELQLRRCLAQSAMISADVNVLHDPNYPDVSSPNNTARMNAGVTVTKYAGSGGKYGASEASAEFMARIRDVFHRAGVLWQTGELGRVDLGGGGTISGYFARYGMDVVDCGMGVLSMHAPFEVLGKLDAYMTFKGYKAFLEARMKAEG